MTASTDARTPSATANTTSVAVMPAPQEAAYAFPSILPEHPLLFKKRKLLPHPKPEGFAGRRHTLPGNGMKNIEHPVVAPGGDNPRHASQSPNARPRGHALKHQPRRIATGPDLPPTPPAHSRNSSSSHSAIPPSPTFVDTPDTSTEDVHSRPKPQPVSRPVANKPSVPRTPKTPPGQRSPPTPEVTPPQLQIEKRPRALRPPINDRFPSKATTDSRTESFTTARENPYSSEEEDGKSTLRAVIPSVRTSSQSTVRQVNGDGTKKKPVGLGLGLGLESSSPESNPTPLSGRSRGDSITFDGEWGDEIEVEQVWDDNLERNVMVRKRRPRGKKPVTNGTNGTDTNGRRHEAAEVVEDKDNTVSPTNATKALRSMTLPERVLSFPSPQETPAKKQQAATPSAAAVLDPSPNITTDTRRFSGMSIKSTDTRRLSGMSTKSTVSTVVEAILVETPPSRQKTLRHVRKQIVLRDSCSDVSPSSSAATSVQQIEDQQRGRRPRPQLNGDASENRHHSFASTGTANTTHSIASRKARREIWKNGGIPVVVVPDRRSSINSHSRTPSLRSTSSRRSRRSQSVGSAPPLSQIPRTKDLAPYFERPSRRGRAMSESDGSAPGDQRTIDYPPMVPIRRSSLSAPTSRNGSRAGSRTGSLTASSLKELDALVTATQPPKPAPKLPPKSERRQKQAEDRKTSRDQEVSAPRFPEVRVEPVPSVESIKVTREHPMHRLSVDHHGDPLFGRRLAAQRTPFSQRSMETNATSHAEVSEAMAVNIYPHQNSSVLMVDHSTSSRPSESSDTPSGVVKQSETSALASPSQAAVAPAPTRPGVRAHHPDADADVGPATPPQPFFSMDDVDSPLRNPRAPPAPPSEPPTIQPPAIQFIPATPSGLTPTHEKEKQLGNFYDEVIERPPITRPLALVRRALSGRRHSEYGPSSSLRSSGLLTRAFSLSRSSSLRRATADRLERKRGKGTASRGPDDETRLHPHWRPARPNRDHDHYYDDDDYYDDEHYDEDDDRRDDIDGMNDRGWGNVGRTYRYPRIDNRPSTGLAPPRRSFSDRVKRAILPSDDFDSDSDYEDDFPAGPPGSPIRRTVRRTPSGNLRVVRHRASLDSIVIRRPYTAPDDGAKRRSFWWSGRGVESSDRDARTPIGGGDGTVALPRRRRSRLRNRSSSVGRTGHGHGTGTSTGVGIGADARRRLSSLFNLARGSHSLPRRLSERRREKRSRELRRTISGPREVRDGVGDVIRRSTYRDAFTQMGNVAPFQQQHSRLQDSVLAPEQEHREQQRLR